MDRLSMWDDVIRARLPFTSLVVPDLGPEAMDGATDGSRLLVRPAILGFVAVSAITVGALQPTSPFALKMAGAWPIGISASGSHSPLDLFFGLIAVYGGLLLMLRVWWGLARTLARTPGVPVRKLAVVLALWILPLLIAPPLFSRDMYSYAAQGEMVSHSIDPYKYGPSVLGASPYVSLVDGLWMNTPAPYGPLFLEVDGAITNLSDHHEFPNLLLLRFLEIGGMCLIAASVPALARSIGRDPGEAFVLGVLNPVVILHLVGGGHNDALMLGLLLAGLAMAKRGRPVIGVVLCALSAAVKVPGAIGILYIGWEWMGTGVPWRERIRPLMTAGLIGGALMAGLSVITGLGFGWMANLGTPGTVRTWLSPATGSGMFLADVAHLAHIGVSMDTTLSLTRGLGLLVAGAASIWLLTQCDRVGSLRAMGLTMFFVVVLGPVVQPWYLAWAMVLLAPVATGKVRSLLLVLPLMAALIGLPGGFQLLNEMVSLVHTNPLAVAVALLAMLVILTVPLTPWDRRQLFAGGSARAVQGREHILPGAARAEELLSAS
jgi:hypothetical protein